MINVHAHILLVIYMEIVNHAQRFIMASHIVKYPVLENLFLGCSLEYMTEYKRQSIQIYSNKKAVNSCP